MIWKKTGYLSSAFSLGQVAWFFQTTSRLVDRFMPVSTVSTVFTTFTSASSGRLSSIFLKDMYLMCLACLRLFRRFQCHVFYVLEIFLDIKVISKQNRSLLKTCWPIYRQCWPDHCNNVCFLGLFGKHVMRGLFCKHFLHHQVEVAHSIRLLNLEKRLIISWSCDIYKYFCIGETCDLNFGKKLHFWTKNMLLSKNLFSSKK